MNDTVSVLVRAHNAEKTLQNCIESILNQSKGADEIWVMDDGSSDNTLQMMFKLAQRYPQIQLLAHHRHDEACCRNRLLDEAQGTWILMMDASESLKKDALKDLMECAKKKHVLISCEPVYWFQCNQVPSKKDLIKQLLRYPRCNQLSGKLFHRRLFEFLRFEENTECSEVGIMAQLFVLASRVAFTSHQVMNWSRKMVLTDDTYQALVRQSSFLMSVDDSLFKECILALRRWEKSIKLRKIIQ